MPSQPRPGAIAPHVLPRGSMATAGRQSLRTDQALPREEAREAAAHGGGVRGTAEGHEQVRGHDHATRAVNATERRQK